MLISNHTRRRKLHLSKRRVPEDFQTQPKLCLHLVLKKGCMLAPLLRGHSTVSSLGPLVLSGIGQAHSASPTYATPYHFCSSSSNCHLPSEVTAHPHTCTVPALLPALLSLKPGHHLAFHLHCLIPCLSLTPHPHPPCPCM